MRQQRPGIDAAAALADWQREPNKTAADWTDYSCTLVTPLYGGGVRAGEVDQALPIRAAGLRGQLRFWWRIACGPFASSRVMFQRESAIWGGIAPSGPTASKVAVKVDANPASPQQQSGSQQMPGFPAYALILDPGANPMLIRSGFRFRLRVRFDPKLDECQRSEVDQALRWWASFGGVGARTRRGLGAVRIEGLVPVTTEEVQAKGGQLLLRAAEPSPEQAWKRSVDRLRHFRQGEGVGRNPRAPGSNTPGQSRWPEADAIRRLTGKHSPRHVPNPESPSLYPRGVFGLPIVFHFKDPGEPRDHTLNSDGRDRDRMASPLILRPYWDGQHWRPAALLLPGWQRALNAEVGFGDGPYQRAWPRDPAERARLAAQIKPMTGRGDDPLNAFMAFFEEA